MRTSTPQAWLRSHARYRTCIPLWRLPLPHQPGAAPAAGDHSCKQHPRPPSPTPTPTIHPHPHHTRINTTPATPNPTGTSCICLLAPQIRRPPPWTTSGTLSDVRFRPEGVVAAPCCAAPRAPRDVAHACCRVGTGRGGCGGLHALHVACAHPFMPPFHPSTRGLQIATWSTHVKSTQTSSSVSLLQVVYACIITTRLSCQRSLARR